MSKITNIVLGNKLSTPNLEDATKKLERLIKKAIEKLLTHENITPLRFLLEDGDMEFSYIPHSARTCFYTIKLADAFNDFSIDKLHQIGVAAILHDIGQTLVSMDVRNKIGKYNDDERKEMQRHPIYSVDIIRKSEMFNLDNDILTAVKSHHELGDKTGYPHNLPLFDLPLEAQILAVTHTFDSYTTERIHRKAEKPFVVIKHMLSNPKKFPVSVVKRFIPLLGNMGEG